MPFKKCECQPILRKPLQLVVVSMTILKNNIAASSRNLPFITKFSPVIWSCVSVYKNEIFLKEKCYVLSLTAFIAVLNLISLLVLWPNIWKITEVAGTNQVPLNKMSNERRNQEPLKVFWWLVMKSSGIIGWYCE